MKIRKLMVGILSLILLGACAPSAEESFGESGGGSDGGPSTGSTAWPEEIPTGTISPDDLSYLGAFRLPGDGWAWGGMAMTYYPDGNPGGPADGAPGSLFGSGFDLMNFVSEISIPAPVISAGKNIGDLNTAGTLQPFADLRLPVFRDPDIEIPRMGLAYLPAQGSQTTGKLYQCSGRHFEDTTVATHGWSELDLSAPDTRGPWRIEGQSFYSVNDYLFEIPGNWADAYAPGMRLATGRYRDGGWSGQGPAIIAIGPWNEGSPPAANSEIPGTPLLLYDRSDPGPNHCIAPDDGEDIAPNCTPAYQNPEARTMRDYHHSDEWTGGAWLTAGDNAAVIFVGTKGLGDRYWYGNYQRPCYNCDDLDRGWYSEAFEAQIIFYDPADLVRVARGEMQPYEPQPYARLSIDDLLFSRTHMLDFNYIPEAQQKYRVGGVTYDRTRQLLYIVEQFADGEKPIVHVWRIST